MLAINIFNIDSECLLPPRVIRPLLDLKSFSRLVLLPLKLSFALVKELTTVLISVSHYYDFSVGLCSVSGGKLNYL